VSLRHVIPLAIGAGINPSFLAVTLELLASGGVGRRGKVLAYLAGAAAPLAGLAAVGLLWRPQALIRAAADDRGALDVADVVLGVLLLGLAVLLVARHQRAAGGDPPAAARLGAGRAAALGFGMMAGNLSTVLLFSAALRVIARSGVGAAAEFGAFVGLLAAALALVWLPLLADVAAPDQTGRALAPLSRLFHRRGRAIGAVVSLGFGVYLIGQGLRAW
jgi:hypothetical protein